MQTVNTENDANMTEQRSVTNTTKLPLQSETNGITELHLQSQTSNESNETSSYFICTKTSALQNDQNHIENNNTDNCPSTLKISRNILLFIYYKTILFNTKSTENI